MNQLEENQTGYDAVNLIDFVDGIEGARLHAYTKIADYFKEKL